MFLNIKFMKKQKSRKNKKPQRFQDSKFYFDDCPICSPMKEAEDDEMKRSPVN